MPAKGLAFQMFYSTMESNTTAYVLCGLAVIVFWGFFSKYMARSADSKSSAAKREERNGGAVSGRHPRAGGGAGGVVGGNCVVNGSAGVTKSKKQADDHGDFIEFRSSGIQGSEQNGPTRGDQPGAGPAEVDGGGLRVTKETGWRGVGPHVVHLLGTGWTVEDLDVLQRPIEVYAWFTHRQCCRCSFELAVTLQDKRRRKIVEYQHGPESFNQTVNVCKKVSLVFENYGAGVRYVTYSHRRRKPLDKECNEPCGTEMYSGLRKLKNK